MPPASGTQERVARDVRRGAGTLKNRMGKLEAPARWPAAHLCRCVDLVNFQKFPAGEAALHVKREFDRQNLFASPDCRVKFKADYPRKWGERVRHRDFGDAHVLDCPGPAFVGKTIRRIADEGGGAHQVDTFLDLVSDYGFKLRWSTLIGNHNPQRVAINLNHPCAIMGFSDAGAHLRNMAFHNFGLALLQLAVQDSPVMTP
jgi:N-acyl-D-aspartate/D-glutamate deacylase